MLIIYEILFLFLGIILGAALMIKALGSFISMLIGKEYPGIVYDEKKNTITFYCDMLDNKKISKFLKS